MADYLYSASLLASILCLNFRCGLSATVAALASTVAGAVLFAMGAVIAGPGYKVPGQIMLNVPRDDRAFSNTPVLSESDRDNGLKTVRFEPILKLTTSRYSPKKAPSSYVI